VVPTGAVQRGPDGPFVYVVSEGRVTMRKVGVGLQNDTDAVLTSGLDLGEAVVTTGFSRLAEGARVTVTGAAPPAAAPAEPPRRGPRTESGTGAGATTTR
jgi:multidrug efflux system membrane fusion protein